MTQSARSPRLLLFLLGVLTLPSLMVAARPDPNKPIIAEGVIDRVVVAGAEPVLRAAGYTFRVGPATELHFSKGLQSISDVGTNTWAIFTGNPDDSGAIVATKAVFIRLKQHKVKPDPNAVQVTAFPPGTKIDSYTGFTPGPKAFLPEDHGGWCGWYEIPNLPPQQEHLRRLGQALVPQYQRDLPDTDSTRIPFRFYIVQEPEIRTAIFCGKGLVLVPREILNRLQSEAQLAAVLADGIAGVMQQQGELARGFTLKEAAELAPYLMGIGGPIPGLVGDAGEAVIRRKAKRGVDRELARMALSYMADAGFDPHQAPEAWRLLAPDRLPKDPTRLKYPERSKYLQSILNTQDKAASGSKSPASDPATTVAPSSPPSR